MDNQPIQTGIGKKSRVLAPNEIVYVEGFGNYSTFFLLKGKSITTTKTLRTYEELLPGFVRAHKGHLFNPAHVESLSESARGRVEVRLVNGVTLPIARRRCQAAIEKLTFNRSPGQLRPFVSLKQLPIKP